MNYDLIYLCLEVLIRGILQICDGENWLGPVSLTRLMEQRHGMFYLRFGLQPLLDGACLFSFLLLLLLFSWDRANQVSVMK